MEKPATCVLIRSFYCFSFRMLSQSCDHREHSTIKITLFKQVFSLKSKNSKISKSWYFSSLFQQLGPSRKKNVFTLLALLGCHQPLFFFSIVAVRPRCSVFVGAALLWGKDQAPWRARSLSAHLLGPVSVAAAWFSVWAPQLLTSGPGSVIYNSYDLEQVIHSLCALGSSSVRLG